MPYEDNKKLGYISLYRSIVEWEWFTDRNTLQVFIYCLAKANHKDHYYKGTLIKRGSFVTSYGTISNDCDLTVKQTRTAIEHLKKSENVASKFNGKGLIISIKNYTEYQTQGKQEAGIGQAQGKQRAPNNNDNNENNGGGTNYTADFIRFWNAYTKHGFKDDCYEYWIKKEFDEETIEDIIYGAKQYSKKFENDTTYMLFPRTFLIDEKWKEFSQLKRKDDEQRESEKEWQKEYFKKMGLEV